MPGAGGDGGKRGLVLETVPLARLKPSPYNPRTISRSAMKGLETSVGRWGLVQPVVWNRRSGHVVGGHQRLKVLEKQGATETQVVVVDLDDVDEKALNIALNNPLISGEFTEGTLGLLDEIHATLPEMSDLLRMPDLRTMLRRELEVKDRAATEDDAPPPPKTPITKPGDLWILGEHRILCGDSTKPEDLARLMDGRKASLLATDPPYLVDYTGGEHPQSRVNKPDVKDKHWDAYVDPETSSAFFVAWLRASLPLCKPHVAVYQWLADRRRKLVEAAWEAAGLFAHQALVWVKSRAVLGRCHFMYQHEPCLYGWRTRQMPHRRPPANASTVWAIDQKGQQDGIHPTQKPVEIFARPIRWHTVKGEVVLEPFSGSGTQIVAAEQLERRCCAMELSPAFVDVAVTRWEQLTGKKAERAR